MTDLAARLRADRILSRFIDPVVLRDYGVTIGLIEIDGAGLRVAVWDGYVAKNMSAAAAKRLAGEYQTGDHSVPLKPVSDALMAMVDKIEAARAAADLNEAAAAEQEGWDQAGYSTDEGDA